MQQVKALSLAPDVNKWLANTHHPRILHVFDNVCNLINERKEVLSIVTQQIGNGPFNLVVEEHFLFTDHLDIKSEISIQKEQLVLDVLTINTLGAQLWRPRPAWGKLRSQRKKIISQLASLSIEDYQPSLPAPSLFAFTKSIATASIPSSLTIASQLAGLGQGLTPSGDDFMMGALYAVWIIYPHEFSAVLAGEIAKTAVPLTTSLSAAWLRSAGKGEAGELWHHLFDALVKGDEFRVQESVGNILAVGETSGADAIAGFIGTLQA